MFQRFTGRGKSTAASSAAPASAPRERDDDAAVLAKIAESKELNEKREAHLLRKQAVETEAAVKAKMAGRKEQALAALRRKKQIDDELTGLVQQRVKLDTQEHALRSLRYNEVSLAVEKAATAAIARKVKGLGGPDAIEEQRANTEDALEDAYELLNIASQPTAVPGQEDDAALEAELEGLVEQKEAEERTALAQQLGHIELGQLEGAGAGRAFPAVPTEATSARERARKQEREAREARELAEIEQLGARMESGMPRLQRMAPVSVA